MRVQPPEANEDGTIPEYDVFAGAANGIGYPDPPTDCTPVARAYTHLTIIPKRAV